MTALGLRPQTFWFQVDNTRAVRQVSWRNSSQEDKKRARGGRTRVWFSDFTVLKNEWRGFPGGAVVENLPANAGDTGSSPGLGRSHMPRSN